MEGSRQIYLVEGVSPTFVFLSHLSTIRISMNGKYLRQILVFHQKDRLKRKKKREIGCRKMKEF